MVYNVYKKVDPSFNVSPNSVTPCTACVMVSPTVDPHVQSVFKMAYGNSARAAISASSDHLRSKSILPSYYRNKAF